MVGWSVADRTSGKWETDWVQGHANYSCEPPRRTNKCELVSTAKESAEQMDKDLTRLLDDFTKFTKKITQLAKERKERKEQKEEKEHKTIGGSAMSHKWVLGAYCGLVP